MHKIFFLPVFFLLIAYSAKGFQSKNDSLLRELRILETNRPADAIILSDSLFLFYSDPDSSLWAKLYFFRGKAFAINTYHQLAVKSFNKAVPLFEKQKDEVFLIKTLIELSSANLRMDNLVAATSQALLARELAIKNNLDEEISASLAALSFVYYTNNDFEKALNYLTEIQDFQINNGDSMGLSATYNNIAILYKKQGELERAIHYNKLSLDINLKLEVNSAIAKSYNNMGRIFLLQKDYQKAKNYYQKAITINEESGIMNSMPIRNMGDLYYKTEAYDLSENYLKQALEMEEINGINSWILPLYKELQSVSMVKNDSKAVLYYQTRIDSLTDLINDQVKEESRRLLENQLKLFEGKQALQTANNKTRVIQFIFLIFVILFLSIFMFFIQKMKLVRTRNERNRALLEQRILRSQMNPHFIFNALSAIQFRVMENEPLKSAAYISRFSKLIRQNFDFTAREKVTLAEDLEALENYIETQLMRFEEKFEYLIKVDKSIETDLVEIPPMLLQPLVENAIEHGFKALKEGGKLTINVDDLGDKILFRVQDNGIGFKSGQIKKGHSTEILIKRLKLLQYGDEKSFTIINEGRNKGSIVQFSLTIEE